MTYARYSSDCQAGGRGRGMLLIPALNVQHPLDAACEALSRPGPMGDRGRGPVASHSWRRHFNHRAASCPGTG
jgi:hypothetical protein